MADIRVRLGGNTTINLKNHQRSSINELNDLTNINEVSLEDGATLVYNSDTSEYDVRIANAAGSNSNILFNANCL